MLTRLLALLAVLLLAPSAQLRADARVLSLENARLGFFTPNPDFLKEIPDLTHCCIKEKTTEQAESSNRREEYLRARYMDPGQGRFASADRTHGALSHPVTLHRYLYGNQNPLIYVDPSGNVGIISVFANAVNSSVIRVGGVSGATTGAAKLVAEFAFEYATGIPVLTSPRNMLRAVKSLKDSVGDLANSFWLRKFRAGTNFEQNVAEVWRLTKNTTCYKNGVPASPPGCFIPDFYVNRAGRFIEVKTSVGAVSKDQFQEFIKLSQRNGEPLAMVFLEPPSAADIAKLQRWAVEVVPGASDELLLKIVHVLE